MRAEITLPGGMITPDQFDAIATIAAEHGSATMELTAQGGIQIHGISDAAGYDSSMDELLPEPGLRGFCSIVASPLSGRVGAFYDIRGLVRELAAAVRAAPELARLPPDFVLGLDDGRGDVGGLGIDVGATLEGDAARLLVSGCDSGLVVGLDEVVDALIGAAARFVDIRGDAARVAELADPAALFDAAALGGPAGADHGPPIGWIEQDDGKIALGAAVPLGLLSVVPARYLAAIDRPLVVTPWRSIVVCDLDEDAADVVLRILAPLGLVFDADSPWLQVRPETDSSDSSVASGPLTP
ncbi:MAG: precorrin-3B synthase [Mycobacterium sp.]